MKKNLDKAYVYKGEVYGPGEVEVPDDFPEGEEVKEASSSKTKSKKNDDG